MNSTTRMFVGRQVLRGAIAPEEAAQEYGVTVQAVRSWVRQAKKLAEAESAGSTKGLKKKGTSKEKAQKPAQPVKKLPSPEKPAPTKPTQPAEGGSTWENLI